MSSAPSKTQDRPAQWSIEPAGTGAMEHRAGAEPAAGSADQGAAGCADQGPEGPADQGPAGPADKGTAGSADQGAERSADQGSGGSADQGSAGSAGRKWRWVAFGVVITAAVMDLLD